MFREELNEIDVIRLKQMSTDERVSCRGISSNLGGTEKKIENFQALRLKSFKFSEKFVRSLYSSLVE